MLVFAVFLAPMPAYFRAMWEWRGSSCNLALSIWRTGKVTEMHREFIVGLFKGPDYYFMWPFPKLFLKKLDKLEEEVRAGKLNTMQRETYKFLEDRAIV